MEGNRYPKELIDFVCTLHPVAPVRLTAALVPLSDYAAMITRDAMAQDGMTQDAIMEDAMTGVPEERGNEEEERIARSHCRRLEKVCDDNQIQCKMHLDREDFALPCLRRESRYADLMLLSCRHFFEEMDSEQPNAWMNGLLHRSECPTLLLPDEAALPGEVILAYDGSADSAFAIRQFAYLFPEFNAVKTTLVFVDEDPKAKIPEEAAIRELCVLHFKKFRVLKLEIKTDEFYDTWVGMMKDPWVVTGSFGRSGLSQLFKGSFSAELIHRRKVPVFVAHR